MKSKEKCFFFFSFKKDLKDKRKFQLCKMDKFWDVMYSMATLVSNIMLYA